MRVKREEKEVIDKDPKKHCRFYCIEPFHGETSKGKVPFVFIICTRFAFAPYLIGSVMRIGYPYAIGEYFSYCFFPSGDILTYHYIPLFFSPPLMHESEFCDPYLFIHRFPCAERIDFPLERLEEPYCDDRGHIAKFKGLP